MPRFIHLAAEAYAKRMMRNGISPAALSATHRTFCAKTPTGSSGLFRCCLTLQRPIDRDGNYGILRASIFS